MDKFLPNPKLKLREQLREVMRFKHFSDRTESAYWHWIKGFMVFCRDHPHLTPALSPPSEGAEREKRWRHPREMHAAEVRAYLSYLAVERQVAVATQNQALNAIAFLYRDVLGLELGAIGKIERPARGRKLPAVLAKDEVRRVLACVAPEYQLHCQLLYGTGMRLLECLRLRVKDVDFARNEITIHDGKGGKDRLTMLPESLKPALKLHLERVQAIHRKDLAEGFGRVSLPHALARKYQQADKEWCWQFVFPAASTIRDRVTGVECRHHVHEVNLQRAVKAAAAAARMRIFGPICRVRRHFPDFYTKIPSPDGSRIFAGHIWRRRLSSSRGGKGIAVVGRVAADCGRELASPIGQPRRREANRRRRLGRRRGGM